MALQSPLRTFEHKTFLSMIDKDDPQGIANYRAANIENWIIRNRSQLEMRDGLTARGTSPSATNLGSIEFIQSSASGQSKYLLRVVDGAGDTAKFQHSTDGSTWTDVSGGGSKSSEQIWSFVQANNFIYGVNGTDTPIKYDGSTVSTVSAIPNGVAIEWWRNHMWILGNKSVPDRLYFSNPNDPETWGGSDFVNVNLGDGSPGSGLKGVGGSTGRMFVGKERSVWYVTGFDSSDFAITPLTYEHGIASHQSMVSVGNEVWAIDLEGNIRGLYRTTEDVPFSAIKSKEIPNTIAGLNRAAIKKTTAIFYDNYAMFFVPNGVDSHNSLVLVWDTLSNEKTGGWTKFTGWSIARATIFHQTRPILFLHDSRTGNGQTYEWTGTSDNGLAITAKYETKIYDHGVPERRKKWKFAYQFAPVIGSVTTRFYTSIDRFYYTLVDTVNLAGTGDAQWDVAQWDVDKFGSEGFVRKKINFASGGATSKGYSLQVKLEGESSTTKLKLRQFTIHYRIMGLR